MVRPNTITGPQAARLLDVPVRFLGMLSERRLFPMAGEDGAYDATLVRAAVRRMPWLRLLGRPLCERELAAIDRRLCIPAGEGYEWAGRRYCALWRCLDAAWGGVTVGRAA